MAENQPTSGPRNYGLTFRTASGGICQNQLEIEMLCFKRKQGSLMKEGRKNPLGRSRFYHFRNIVDMLWNYPNSTKTFAWHPWAIEMFQAMCDNKRVALAGCGSSGKSDAAAVWALVNWLAAPRSCMVLVTSTTKSAAKNRIWGKVCSYFNALPGKPPGVLSASTFDIRYYDHRTGLSDHLFGIKLVAGEPSKAAQSADEIRGIKGDPLILIADEMPELSPSLVLTFNENLTSNFNHQIIAIGNPGTYFDPFGEFCEPVEGWDSVNEDDYEWMSKTGAKVIRFNAELSPNILEGKVIYPFLMRADQLEEKQARGMNTVAYYRGVKGFWFAMAEEQTIYSPAELMGNPCKKAVWRGETTKVAGFDPAYTSGGDRSIFKLGTVGVRTDGVLCLEAGLTIEVNEDVRDKETDRTTQMIRKLKKLCEEHGVALRNFAIDASSGSGKTFRDAMISQWGTGFLCVDFSGSPSDLPVSATDPTKSRDFYDRRVSELWYSGKEFIRADQLRGVDNELAQEMVMRRFTQGKKIKVETKTEMKLRLKRSPDCFVAGTMVLTPTGERPIETLQVGDAVVTPMGVSRILKVHRSRTEELTTIRLSSGRELTGKGAHKVLTHSRGWVPMRDLSLTDTFEADTNVVSWKLLRSLFTRVGNIDFKPLVDIIKIRTGAASVQSRDFFIESSGLSTMGLFLRGCVSITKMVTGRITRSKIWNSWRSPNTSGCTRKKGGPTPTWWQQCKLGSILPESTLRFGTDLLLVGSGTDCTASPSQQSHEKKWSKPALSVGKSISPRNPEPLSSAHPLAEILATLRDDRSTNVSVSCAELTSWVKNLLLPKPVRLLAEPTSQPKSAEVFNLTLDTENVYYANGVLVQNCADAFFVLLDLCRQRHKFVSADRPANHRGVAVKPMKKMFRDLQAVYAA
jgi:hypothetical protein